MKLMSKTYSKQLFSTTLLKEQRPAPFVEHPGHSLLSAKVSKNEMDKQIALITNSSYQSDFLKIAVLNRSIKGAMISSFCREHPVHSLLQQEVNENKFFKQIALSITGIYQ